MDSHFTQQFVELLLREKPLLRGSGDIGAMLSTCWGVCQVDKGNEQNLRGKPQTEGFSAQSAVSDPGTAFYRRNWGLWALFRCRSVLGL
jgi:hypothetical protein